MSLWRWLAAPEHSRLLALWIEAYARSLVEPDGPWAGFAARTVDDWLGLLADFAADPTDRTLVLAVLRGALLDLLATGTCLAPPPRCEGGSSRSSGLSRWGSRTGRPAGPGRRGAPRTRRPGRHGWSPEARRPSWSAYVVAWVIELASIRRRRPDPWVSGCRAPASSSALRQACSRQRYMRLPVATASRGQRQRGVVHARVEPCGEFRDQRKRDRVEQRVDVVVVGLLPSLASTDAATRPPPWPARGRG